MAGIAAILGSSKDYFIPTSGANMRKHPKLSRSIGQAALATGLAIAFFPAFAADFPAGTYLAEGSKTTVKFEKGQFVVEDAQKTVVTGKYTIKGSQMRITDKDGPWACTKDGEQSGTYRWTYVDSVLTFQKVADACADRVGSLQGVKWKTQP